MRHFSILLALTGIATAQTTITLGSDTTPAIRPLLGVNSGPQASGESTVDLTTRFQDAGINMIRVHDYNGPMDMSQIYPDQNADPSRDSSYNWTQSDVTWKKVLDGGFEPYLRIGYSNNVRPVTNQTNWAAAAVAIVRRYTDATRWGRNAIRYVEIYNEPDNRTFWTGTNAEFSSLYITTSKALKSAFPSLKIGGCGFTGTQYDPLPNVAQGQFLRPFLAAISAAGAPLDFFSWHTYTNVPQDMATGAQYFRAQLQTYGYGNAESILSEWNTDFEGPSGGDANLRTGARGSSILAATWIVLQGTDVLYTMLYRGGDPSLGLPTFYGLWYADGRPKPAALAQTIFSQMAKYTTRVAATTAGTTLSVIAGRNANGERAVLLANTGTTPVSWTLNGSTGSGNVYKMQEISGSATAIVSSTLSSLSGSIPAYGVQLVTISAGPSAVISAVAGAGGSVPAVTSISPNGYFTIYGSGFAAAGTARSLQSTDIKNNALPTSLANTCVNVGSTRAFLSYVSPGQINALAPTVSGSSASISVVTNCGTATESTTSSVSVPVAASTPEFLYFVQNADGRNPVAAVNSLTGVPITGTAKSGDLVTLFAIGFGATTPATTPGSVATAAAITSNTVVTIGGINAVVSYSGVSPNFAGLYQINVTIPAGVASGSQAISATVGGVKAADGARISIQ